VLSSTGLPEPKQGGAESKGLTFLRFSNGILVFSIIISVALILFLSREKHKFQGENAKLKARLLSLSEVSGNLVGPASIQIGDIVPPFEALTIEGKQAGIVYDGSTKYLLYIFSPLCDVCASQLPEWNKLAGRAAAENYTTLGLSTASAEETKLNASNQSFDILIMPSKYIQRAYRVVSEPLVIIVSSQGKIEYAHYGDLTEDKVAEITDALNSHSRGVRQ